MAESRFSLGQVLGVAAGIVVLVGVAALAGGGVGYQLGKADGQALAQAGQRIVVESPDGSGRSFSFRLPFGGFSLPQPSPFEGEVPPEFSAPRAFLGVRFEPVDEDLAQAERLSVSQGAIIREVIADSPAAQAGLRVGDIVTAIDGEPVDAEHTLRDGVAARDPGDTIELTVLRGDETLTMDVTLGERRGIQIEGFRFRVPDDGQFPFFGDPSDCLPRGEQG